MTRHCTEEVSDIPLPPVGIDVVLPPPPGLVVRHLAPPVLVLIFPLQIIQIILQLFKQLNYPQVGSIPGNDCIQLCLIYLEHVQV